MCGTYVWLCRSPGVSLFRLPLMDFAADEEMFWALMMFVLLYNGFAGLFVAMEWCVRRWQGSCWCRTWGSECVQGTVVALLTLKQ